MEVAHCYLDGSADAVEFCPNEKFSQILAVATYNLEQDERPNRSGSVSLFEVEPDAGSLSLLNRVHTNGVFDIKWSTAGSSEVQMLAQADSAGLVKVYALEFCSDSTQGMLREMCSTEASSSMCLCLDWSPSAASLLLGVTNGNISLYSFSNCNLDPIISWKAHEFEVWAVLFDTHDPNLMYSGSDDGKFSCWDVRKKHAKPVLQSSTVHPMGVCCISKSANDGNTLYTGGYDEHLRAWDMRSMSEPVASVCLGGGIWRIKQHPEASNVVLAACMHNGFAITVLGEGGIVPVEYYSKHGSLAYGADWQKGVPFKKKIQKHSLVATCSFYDRLLRVWTPKTNYSKS